MNHPDLMPYKDIFDTLERALTLKGGKLTFTTTGEATAWRARAHRARKAYRTLLADGRFEVLKLRILPEDKFTVVFDYLASPKGVFTPPPGTEDTAAVLDAAQSVADEAPIVPSGLNLRRRK